DLARSGSARRKQPMLHVGPEVIGGLQLAEIVGEQKVRGKVRVLEPSPMESIANIQGGCIESVGVGICVWNLICRIRTSDARGAVGAEVKLPTAVGFRNFDCTAVWDDGPRSCVRALEGRPA